MDANSAGQTNSFRPRPRRASLRVSTLRKLCTCLFVAAVAVFLITPVLVEMLAPNRAAPSENRGLASWPAAPRSFAETLNFPAQVDAYVQDHFGLRYEMIALHNRLQYELFGEMPTRQVVEGNNGRLFFTSHFAATPFELILTSCGVGVSGTAITTAAQGVASLIGHLREVTPRSLLLIVPTAPVVYPEDLPGWLSRRCAHAEPPGFRVAAQLPNATKAAWAYPLRQELRLKQSMNVFPHHNFHWLGAGPHTVINSLAEQRLGLVRHVDVPTRPQLAGSDLGQFLLGLWFYNRVALPEWRSAGIEACTGPACFPELGGIAQVLQDVSRYRTPNAGGERLLVLSDSFGLNAAGYFSQYVGEVWHFSTNNIAVLSPDQLKRFETFIFAEYRPDIVVAIYHDGALLGWPKQLTQILWPSDAVGDAAPPGETAEASSQ